MPPNTDLSLAPTVELIEELARRHEAAIFTAYSFDDDVCVYLHGSALTCSGLLVNAQNEILWYSIQGRMNESP